jgi:hypothetical protein
LTALQLTPVVLSLLVLAAHFLRAGRPGLVGVLLLCLVFLAVRRAWAARAIQIVLVLGALEWTRTLFQLAAWRAQAGQSSLRLIIILGSVALLTGLSALVFRTARMRERYQLVSRRSSPRVTESEGPGIRGEEND